jgi:hypothetical protein
VTDIYLVIGYFDYEGCEPIAVFSTLDKAVTFCKEAMRGYDGTEVIKYTLDRIGEGGVTVHKEKNRNK